MKRFSFQFNYNAAINLSGNRFLLLILDTKQTSRASNSNIAFERPPRAREASVVEKWHLSCFFFFPVPFMPHFMFASKQIPFKNVFINEICCYILLFWPGFSFHLLFA